MTALETLKAARQLINDPKHWAQGYFALNAKGKKVCEQSHHATRFCAVGALKKVNPDGWTSAGSLIAAMVPHSISTFNDTHKHEEVLALLDSAIHELETLK